MERAPQLLLLDSLGLFWPEDSHEMYVRIQEVQDDRAALLAPLTSAEIRALQHQRQESDDRLTSVHNAGWSIDMVEQVNQVKGMNIIAYTQRFQELALLCQEMVTPETRMIKRYIGGLSQNIKGNVTSSKPTNIHETITMAHSLMDQVIQDMGMNVQKQGTIAEETRSEATRIREAEMEETMVKETRMGIKLAKTLASWHIMLMLKERPSRVS
ncbi:hypothetical protein Tco_0837763 [Tanacetum coccineum]